MSARRAFAAAAVLLAAAAWASAAPALTAAEQLAFADGIYTRGLHESAVGEYLALLRDFPDAPEAAAALFRTGECYRQLGNAQGAERFYRRVAAEHPGTPLADRAELRRAELEIDAGNKFSSTSSIFTKILTKLYEYFTIKYFSNIFLITFESLISLIS